MKNLYIDRFYLKKYKIIAGIDEAGYGALAGPVCVGVVVFDKISNIYKLRKLGVDDSKKLKSEKRKELFKFIKDFCYDWAVCFVNVEIINKKNIKNASIFGARESLKLLKTKPNFVIIDGIEKIKYLRIPQTSVIKGDQKSIAVASASIIAKVIRDELMIRIGRIYKEYGFSRNKGYGTKYHIKALKKFGKTKLHRKKFINNII